MNPEGNRSALIGGILWLVSLAWLRPSLLHELWGVALLLLAVLVIVPLSLRLMLSQVTESTEPQQNEMVWAWWLQKAAVWQLPAAVALMLSFALPEGHFAGALTLPWLLMLALISVAGIKRAQHSAWRDPAHLCICGGMIYLSVGGIWAAFARAGMRPLGFDSAIVLLTAIHFHYAGFVLPLLTGMAAKIAAKITDRKIADSAVWLVLSGVPLTALGITITQVSATRFPETIAAVMTATGGMMTAILYLKLATLRGYATTVRMLWVVTGLALIFSMTLAMLYGLRAHLPIVWLDIPLMRALHGTANAAGFALSGIASWHVLHFSRTPAHPSLSEQERP
jgi:hypothetical protein